MPREFDPTKLEQRPRMSVKLSFRALCDSILSGLHAFDNMAISSSLKRCENQQDRL